MTGISDEYVAEAALVPAVSPIPVKKKPFATLSRALHSGLGVACICFMVALAAVGGTAAWGRISNPAPPDSDPLARFSFAYTISGEGDQVWNGHALPGDTLYVDTTLTNRGLPFLYSGASTEYCAHARFVLQADDTVTIDGGIVHTTDVGTFPVLMGEEGHGQYYFTVPEDATPGVYDLVLSYKGTVQVYKGVLTVGDATGNTKFPEITTDHPFSFGYEPFLSGTITAGDELTLEAWVVNDGEGFKVSGEFRPQATLCYKDETTTYTVEGEFVKGGISPTTSYVASGAAGRGNYVFDIPEDAPAGSYSLVLSFDGATQSFAGVVTVDNPFYPFSFGYSPFGGIVNPGNIFTIGAWVINEGESFTYIGDSYKETGRFYPTVTLCHQETGYTIKGMPPEIAIEPIPYTVQTGQKGSNAYEITIPADAPTGKYNLVLFYGNYSTTFERVLTVAEPTVEDNTYIDPNDLWEVAEQYISQVVENADPAHYTRGSITTTTFPSEEYSICFGFHVNLLGTATEETLYITLNAQGQYLSHEQDPQTYSLFIPYITTEMVEAAKPPLYEHLDAPLELKHQYGYAIQDGDLYLTYTCYAEPGGNFETAWECLYSTQVFLYPSPQAE